MASYPSGVYAPRTKENPTGTVYTPSKKTIGFAEDVTKLDDEVVAVETELGTNPKGVYNSVKDFLTDLLNGTKHTHESLGSWWYCCHWLPAEFIENSTGATGGITWSESTIKLATGTTNTSYAQAYKQIIKYGSGTTQNSWNKTRRFKVNIRIKQFAEQIIHIVQGNATVDVEVNTSWHIGFKILDNKLYATVGNGSAETTDELYTLTGTKNMELEAVLIPGENCKCYLDGNLVSTITTNLPTGGTLASFYLMTSIQTTEAVNKEFLISQVSTLQEQD